MVFDSIFFNGFNFYSETWFSLIFHGNRDFFFFWGAGGSIFYFFWMKGVQIGFHCNWENEDKASCAVEMDSLKITQSSTIKEEKYGSWDFPGK